MKDEQILSPTFVNVYDLFSSLSPYSLLLGVMKSRHLFLRMCYSCSPTLQSVSETEPHGRSQGTTSLTDTCAGPDIAPFEDGEQFDDSEFRPATEVFSGGDLDFLQQHGTDSSSVSHLARQSLYVKFDPLIGGRPSVMGRPSMAPFKAPQGVESLIDMKSPSPCKKSGRKPEQEQEEEEAETTTNTTSSEAETTVTLDPALSLEETEREQYFQRGLLEKEEKLLELQRDLKVKMEEVEELKEQLKVKLDSESQMREVVAEYERTISELISDKEKEKSEMEVNPIVLIINTAKLKYSY